jgi:TRAP-type C4-dicarboxylate transport system permease small subunit
LTDRLPQKIRLFVEIVAHLIGLLFSILFVIACIDRFNHFWVRDVKSYSVLSTPLYLPAVFMVVGSIMFLLQMFVQTIDKFYSFYKEGMET